MTTKPKLDADLSGEPVDQTDYRSKIGSLMYLTSSRPDIVQGAGDKLVSWMSKKQDCTAMSSAEAEYVALSASCAQNRGPLHALSDHIVIADHEDDIMGIVMQCTTLSQHSEDELTRLIEKIVTIWFTLTVLSALRHSGNENKQEWLNLILCVRDPSFELEPCRDSLNLLITGRIFTIIGNSFPLTGITSTKEVPLKETTITPVITPYSKLKEPKQSWGSTVSDVPSSSLIDFRNDHIAKIIGYGDYQMGNVTISRVYYVEGLIRGLPKLKYQKDHLCFACALGKSKKHSHKPKAKDFIQEKLYLLQMDLCGPMRI
ncbi:hypothetical protein Tco_0704690 [Tanacetum coccineum]|uniref:Uncharacterized protein n=1 Tax=Tanacetum coccineum TaxID=301880 RepID=A0ABQ4Y2J3_9ASTR